MHAINIPHLDKSVDIPSHLGECTAVEYADMCDLLYQYNHQKIDFLQLRVAAVYRLLKMDFSSKKRSEEDQEAVETNIYLLSELIDSFFTTPEEGPMVLRQEFNHNPTLTIPCATKTLYGPDDYMIDITFGQYVEALNVFSTYVAQPDEELLYLLASIFFRKKNTPYSEKQVQQNVKALKTTGFGYIYGVYLSFASFQHHLTSAIVLWEGKEYDLSILFKSHYADADAPTATLPGLGMKSTAFMLAKSQILGNLAQVNNTILGEVLLLMYDLRKDDIEQKIQSKKANNGNS